MEKLAGSSSAEPQPTGRQSFQNTLTGSNRILPQTRLVSAIIVPFLVAAFGILYLWPNDTDKLFAWTIKPQMTAMMLGATYIGGAYFFIRAIFSRQWQRVKLGFLPVTAFASFMGVATLLHWDRFNHNHIAFWTWAILYFTTPFLVFGIWWWNRPADPGLPAPVDAPMPQFLRVIIGIVGIFGTVVSLLLFLTPDFMITIWPWKLTLLTARVVGSQFALLGVVGLGLMLDRRWSAARILLQSQFVTLFFFLGAVIFSWADFDKANPITWAFTISVVMILIALPVLFFFMDIRPRSKQKNLELGSQLKSGG
jgi:hypothetical protein